MWLTRFRRWLGPRKRAPGLQPRWPRTSGIRAAASSQGVVLLPFEARDVDDIDRAFLAVRTERAEALIVVGGPMLGSQVDNISKDASPGDLPIEQRRSSNW
jgi:hypothetical protein